MPISAASSRKDQGACQMTIVDPSARSTSCSAATDQDLPSASTPATWPASRHRSPARRAAAAAPGIGDVTEVERIGDHVIQRRTAAGRAAGDAATGGPGRPCPERGCPGPHCRCPSHPEARPRLRGRPPRKQPSRPAAEPLVVNRRVSVRGRSWSAARRSRSACPTPQVRPGHRRTRHLPDRR